MYREARVALLFQSSIVYLWFKYLSIVRKFSLRICRIKISFSKGLKICQCLLERRVENRAADVKMQQAAALQLVNTFSVAVDESVNINDIPRLAIIVR